MRVKPVNKRRISDRELPVRDEDKDEMKQAMRDALREWLDEKYAIFGKWSLHGLLAAGLVGMVYMFMVSQGWHK